MSAPTDTLLAERAKTHGSFADHAFITQELKSVMQASENYWKLTHEQRESLDMVVHKIGRILAGNPNYADHWDDIAGYARLISKHLTETVPPVEPAADE